MARHTIAASQHAFSFRPDVEPALRVRPGDSVRFETTPEPIERLFAAGDSWRAALDSQRINAVTGPVYIEGIEPGDIVSVEILELETADWGWTFGVPGSGLAPLLESDAFLRRVPLRRGRAQLSERLSVPIQPMIGCLGLAPATGATSTLAPPYPWAGNYDLPQMAVGATAMFPAQVAGGLFSLGDLHAAMGAGEPASVAIECAGAATVRLGGMRGLTLHTPRIQTAERLYVLGFGDRRDWDAARRHAAHLLYDYLTTERGLSPADAQTLFAAAAAFEFGGPAGVVVVGSVPTNVF
jgi:amidase